MTQDTHLQRKSPSGRLNGLRQFSRAPLRFFEEVSRQGDGGVVPFSLLHLRCFLVVRPEGVQQVLARGAVYSRITPDTAIFAAAIGKSLLTTEGPSWFSTRRLMQPTFSRGNVSSFAEAITGATAAMLGRWEERRQGGELALDMVEEMRQLTLSSVARALFSTGDATPLVQPIDALAAAIGAMFRSPTIVLPALGIPLPPNLRLRAALRRLDPLLYRVIDDHLTDVRQGSGGFRDLLTLLIGARDEEGHELNRRELRNELLDVLLAGQETTASLLIWALALLALHPSIEAQLHAELDAILAGSAPTAADLSRLPVLTCVVQETLRLYPPAWMIARVSLKDDEVCGHHIKRKSLVFLSPWITGRNPGCWQDPEEFLPERFALGANPPTRGAYFPFGIGGHRCIGEHLAVLEAQLVLATLLQRYRLQVKEGYPLTPGVFPALRPSRGLSMDAYPR